MSTVPIDPAALGDPITPDQLVADALERAADDLTARAETLDALPLADVYRRSALAVTAMRAGLSRTPAATLTAAVEVARSRYHGADVLAARILAGEAEALTEGERWQRDASDAAQALTQFVGDDGGEVEALLGMMPVIDAVLVATGEQPSDDPAVHARFRDARLAWHRRHAERWLAELDETATTRPLTAVEASARGQCVIDLDNIAEGVEPS